MTLIDADRTNEWLRRDEDALAPVLSRVFDLVADHGEGSWLVDVDGRRFLDLKPGDPEYNQAVTYQLNLGYYEEDVEDGYQAQPVEMHSEAAKSRIYAAGIGR